MARTGARGGEHGKGADDGHALFQLPLSEFTEARNALAGRLKKDGKADQAEAIKALKKPSIAAWVVNQLYWRHRVLFDRLMAAGERFRKAQAAQLAGQSTDMKGPLDARRGALAELARTSATILRDSGTNPAPDMMRRVATTLEALAAYGNADEAPAAGTLIDDLQPPGFETIAALVPQVGRSSGKTEPTRVLRFQPKVHTSRKGQPEDDARRREAERKERRAAAQAALRDAGRELRDARTAAQHAEQALKKAAGRAKEADREKSAAEVQLEKATSAADTTRQEARRVAAEAETAAQVLQDAERAIEKAQRAVSELE